MPSTDPGGVTMPDGELVGWFHHNRTLCTSCHPQDCPPTDCHGISQNDVTEGHAGGSCDQCGSTLPGSDAWEA